MSGPRKSFQVPMKVKTAQIAVTGLQSGRMIRHQIATCPRPSTRAASTSDSGICAMNCRYMKMKNALPKNAGTTSGMMVSIQPNCRKSRKSGIIVTCPGSIMVPSMTRKSGFRPRKRRRAKA